MCFRKLRGKRGKKKKAGVVGREVKIGEKDERKEVNSVVEGLPSFKLSGSNGYETKRSEIRNWLRKLFFSSNQDDLQQTSSSSLLYQTVLVLNMVCAKCEKSK